MSDMQEKRYMTCHILTMNLFFACWIVLLRLLKLNIKARHYTPGFLSANLLSIDVIALDIAWS